MIEPKIKEPIGFTEAMKTLKAHDRPLFQMMAYSFNFKTWGPMLSRLKEHDITQYREVEAGITALKEERPHHEHKDALKSLNRIARMLAREYRCDSGFQVSGPVMKTVTIQLKHPNVITGLPPEIMTQGNYLAQDFGGRRKWTFGWDNRVINATVPEEAIERIQSRNDVESIFVEPMARIMSNEEPDYNPSGVNTDWGVSRVHPQGCWDQNRFGENIKVCVIDTGIVGPYTGTFAPTHQAFWKDGATNYKGGYNFVTESPNPADDHDHGTFCAGIIAHKHNGLAGSYRGIAPNIDLYVCKALDAKGSGSYGDIAAAVDWARTHGCHIISMSLGGAAGQSVLQTACDNAWYAGLLLVAAAGNEGPDPNTVIYPARYMSVMAVAAAEWSERIADFSSRGPEVEITGPGRYIVGPWAGLTYDEYVVAGSNNLYICASGTSAACPHIAACAALLKQWYPSYTNKELRQWLIDHARDL